MDTEPFLSVVATSRNDDHGGDMRRRMQLFLTGLAEQADRHRLPLELVLVEWNPPADRPRLREALNWPRPSDHFRARIIVVPARVHNQIPNAQAMPLFQMIAKNVGIRRARANWVLSTNVDLLFSDRLFAFLAGRRLDPNFHYRSDRIDVDPNVPDVDLDLQLDWCREHVLRENRPWGIVTRDKPSNEAPASTKRRIARAAARLHSSLEHAIEDAVGDEPSHPPRSIVLGLFRLASLVSGLARIPVFPIAYWIRDAALGQATGALAEAIDAAIAQTQHLPSMHTFACGDFILMHRDAWNRIHGHPEMPFYSYHLDTLTLIAAEAHGIHEVRLPPDAVHFHIEHGYWWQWRTRSDETPLYLKMRERGLPTLSYPSTVRIGQRVLREKLLLAESDWGLANEPFEELPIG